MDASDYRRLMSHWATGVSIVTCSGADGPAGCTVNAVASVSLEPPLLLVCFDLKARTLPPLRSSKRFCVNILSRDQALASARFSGTDAHWEKFECVDYEILDGVPVLAGCVGFCICELREEAEFGDHVIVIGSPTVGEASEREPLLFFRSRYHGVSADDALAKQKPM